MRRRKAKSNIPEYYEIKYLIDGSAVGKPGKTLVAIPDKFEGKKTKVLFETQQMTIENVGKDYVAFREFDDKFGRDKHYRLIYYEWNPMTEEEVEMENAKKYFI